jgi:hypothetical protein
MTKFAVEFDPDYIFASMQLWRESIDLTIPMKDEFKIHMMRNRRPILENFVRAAGGWLSTLKAMTPVDIGAEHQLREVIGEVEDFNAWAESELSALDDLLAEE